MNYIPADKLIVEIERRKQTHKSNIENGFPDEANKISEDDHILSIIASLQQEPRFPQYNNIVDKVFGAGNLEGFEYREAEMLVALAKEELLKSLQQEQTPTEREIAEAHRYAEMIRERDKARIQQDQPEVNLVAELKHHLATTPKEQLEKEWKELEPWGNIGPTVQEFLYEKQPKVDLEQFDKDVTEIWGRCAAEPNDSIACLHIETFIKVARHFWNKGYNARKEE